MHTASLACCSANCDCLHGQVVSAPGPSVSHLQIEAYKKLVLIQLLSLGSTSPLPRYTNNLIKSGLRSLCGGAYQEFVTAFEAATKRIEKGKKAAVVVEKFKEPFERVRWRVACSERACAKLIAHNMHRIATWVSFGSV